MPKRDLIVRLEDIRKIIIELDHLVTSVQTGEAFMEKSIYKLAMERIFQIIGEALFQINKDFPEVHFTDAQKIIGLRHILAHDYFRISHDTLWNAYFMNIPILRKEVNTLIDKENLRLFGTIDPALDI